MNSTIDTVSARIAFAKYACRKSYDPILKTALKKLRRSYLNEVYGMLTIHEAIVTYLHFNCVITQFDAQYLLNKISNGDTFSICRYFKVDRKSADNVTIGQYYCNINCEDV